MITPLECAALHARRFIGAIRIFAFASSCALVGVACSLSDGLKVSCQIDSDCNPGRTCQNGTCGSPQAAALDGGAVPLSGSESDGGGVVAPATDASSGEAAVDGSDQQTCGSTGPGLSDCGSAANESCCQRLSVTGGSFDRSYDNVSFTSPSATASVSGFRLEKFEITVGRFRKFVAALRVGWFPKAGSGKHTHLSAGGLNGGTESGWVASWNGSVLSADEIDQNLACGIGATWTNGPDGNEEKPITCATWYELQAFCIFEGGFLPTETEWNYAAAGGSEQRVFPWSSPPSSTDIDCNRANYAACEGSIAAVGSRIGGAGKWGHVDLAGNVWEQTLDGYAEYRTPWNDAAFLDDGTDRVARGGSVQSPSGPSLTSSFRSRVTETNRDPVVGARCAFAP